MDIQTISLRVHRILLKEEGLGSASDASKMPKQMLWEHMASCRTVDDLRHKHHKCGKRDTALAAWRSRSGFNVACNAEP